VYLTVKEEQGQRLDGSVRVVFEPDRPKQTSAREVHDREAKARTIGGVSAEWWGSV
jgi:hypothetical protein